MSTVALMRISCPNCSAQYEVEDTAIPDAGRDVQCSACGHAWFQMRPVATPLVAPSPDPVPDNAVANAPPPVERKPLDEQVMAILREEALREIAERKRQAAGAPAALPDPAPVLASPEAAPPVAQAAAPLPGPERAVARRSLLPDIEETNSVLSGGSDQAAANRRQPQDPRSGFRAGFGLMMLVVVTAASVYVLAPRIIDVVPESAHAMTRYVGTVDQLRRQLDAGVMVAQQQVESLLHSVE
jgi:predicted Zn finger-like uncharacterized protein